MLQEYDLQRLAEHTLEPAIPHCQLQDHLFRGVRTKFDVFSV